MRQTSARYDRLCYVVQVTTSRSSPVSRVCWSYASAEVEAVQYWLFIRSACCIVSNKSVFYFILVIERATSFSVRIPQMSASAHHTLGAIGQSTNVSSSV